MNPTQAQLAAVFAEWERRFREDNRAFCTDFEKFSASAESYGDACAPYFLALFAELFPAS